MSTALEIFRQQKAGLEELREIALSISTSIAGARAELDALAHHEVLRGLLSEEQRWLRQTEEAVQTVRRWREREAWSYWPRLVWRWLVAAAFALMAATAAGAGYVWAAHPYVEEISYLRGRNAFAERVDQRMRQMTPAERKQLEVLLHLAPSRK